VATHPGIEAANAAAGGKPMHKVRSSHPPFWTAIVADARIAAAHRGERYEFRSRADGIGQALRLAWSSDAFLAQALYRLRSRLQAFGIPVLPRLLGLGASMVAQVEIGDPVVIEPGVQIAHGQVVLDGLSLIQTGTVIAPFVSIGLRAGSFEGPVIEEHVYVGTGARILGPLRIGAGARIGANAVVTKDVAAGATVAGVPARPL
jgi:serine O-acetyltransferase